MPNNLELPALEELRCDDCWESPSEIRFLSLLKRSSCRLQSLILGNIEAPWSDFVPLLENMPDLKKLSFKTELSYPGLFTELSKLSNGLLWRSSSGMPAVPARRLLVPRTYRLNVNVLRVLLRDHWKLSHSQLATKKLRMHNRSQSLWIFLEEVSILIYDVKPWTGKTQMIY